MEKTDEAWLVVDRDRWSEEHLDRLFSWTRENANQHLALSHPMFEYWLLLHFDDGHGVRTAQECIPRLKRYLATYDKNIEKSWFPIHLVNLAIARARKRDSPPCENWPRKPGCTTVYRLVEKLLQSALHCGLL